MVGGNGHVVGRADSEAGAVADLQRWTGRYFPGARATHAWSAQDYRAMDRVPYVGEMPRGGGRIYVATGYKPGDQAAWEQQLRTRAQAQNEYARDVAK